MVENVHEACKRWAAYVVSSTIINLKVKCFGTPGWKHGLAINYAILRSYLSRCYLRIIVKERRDLIHQSRLYRLESSESLEGTDPLPSSCSLLHLCSDRLSTLSAHRIESSRDISHVRCWCNVMRVDLPTFPLLLTRRKLWRFRKEIPLWILTMYPSLLFHGSRVFQ